MQEILTKEENLHCRTSNKPVLDKEKATEAQTAFLPGLEPLLPGIKKVRFVDLFSGMSGIRCGFEAALAKRNWIGDCVLTSEIKPAAISVLKQNRPEEEVKGDIREIDAKSIPDFDVLLAGFPCQAFSSAGRRLGFEDTRGTLFFEVARILKAKRPAGFVLENVEGLVKHDLQSPKDKIGRTLLIILNTLKDLGYSVSWKVLNALDFGIPQDRKRIYITGTLKKAPSLENFKSIHATLEDILESGISTDNGELARILLSKFKPEDLYGKSVKDKRGGEDNIHSWDLELKGEVTPNQKALLDRLLKERRKKHWAPKIGIEWMDGMPLTLEQIRSFWPSENLYEDLEYLTRMGYLSYEYPKKKVGRLRVPDESLPKGYNIVTGKMSFEINKILDPKKTAPTLVAMDMARIHVVDGQNIRPLTLREGLRLFGYPEDFKFDVPLKEGFDLLGNTVVVPVITAVSNRLLDVLEEINW